MRVITVGSEPNSLTASLLLARAGHDVQVLGGKTLGGLSSLLGNAPFDPEVARRLGIELPEARPGRLGISSDGRRVTLARAGIGGDVSLKDEEQWLHFVRLMDDAASLSRALFLQPLADVASTWRELGRRHALEVLRTPWHNLRDFLDEWFESELLKATLAAAGLKGSRQGPFASGTVFLLLQRWARGEVLEASPAPLEALSAKLAQAGVLLLDDSASKFELESGRVRVVHTMSGEALDADLVITGEDATTTVGRRLKLRDVAPEMVDALQAWRTASTTGAARLEQGDFGDFGSVSFVETVVSLEKAYDSTKYGRDSEAPFAELETGSGRLWVQHLAGHPGTAPFEALSRSYGLGGLVDTLTPADLERDYGTSGGHLLGGEPALWQSHALRDVFVQPVPNLHLCGPGVGCGDYSGRNGERCADRILGERLSSAVIV